ALAEQSCQEESQEESSTLMQLNHREMTGDELNELNEGLPWWVKKKIIDSRRQSHPPAPPPPAPPRYPCSIAEPQSPRNVSKDFVGLLPPKVQPVGLYDEFPNLIHVNTHFHLGGEHQNVDEGGYSLNYTDAGLAGNIVPNDIRPGYFCAPVSQEPEMGDNWTLADYNWTSCKNVKMGYTYEFHWVHSTAGPIDGVLSGGLGGVFNRSINPTAFVRGQICRIVNWPEQEYKMFNTTWREPVRDSVVYIGSTTGTSYDNYKCSPAEVTWHVDRECCILSAQNMDRMCADLLEYGRNMGGDVQPAPSRLLVAPFISDTNALAEQSCQEESQEESSTLMQLNHREMTGDELNELNEGLPWWVKKKIIDSRRQSHPDISGYFCAPVNYEPDNVSWTLDDYNWTSCKNVKMGYTYEFHWVHSTAGPIDGVVSGGFGGVFNRSISPTAFVRGQICRIVNWPAQEYKMFNTTWREPVRDSVVYIGSTTGTSYDNYKCSPAEVTWHVDRECCILSAQNMDRMCADLLEYGRNMGGDVQPAPSRLLVAPFISDTNASFIANYTST
ncbi:unnamed protein product, partial [Cladocopium goreaui]